MTTRNEADEIDGRLLLALTRHPRATTVALAEQTGLSRNTVQARLARLEGSGPLTSFERRVDPAFLGYPLKAFLLVKVTQRRLDDVGEALDRIPEVLEVLGVSGAADLLAHVVARDADDLYRVTGHVLGIKGVKRTTTALVMREMVDYRVEPLLRGLTG